MTAASRIGRDGHPFEVALTIKPLTGLQEIARPVFLLRLDSMPAPTTPEEALEQATLGPQSATVDGNTVVQRSLDELRREEQYQASKRAASTNEMFGMRCRVARGTAGGC